jgi:hypothetical protein
MAKKRTTKPARSKAKGLTARGKAAKKSKSKTPAKNSRSGQKRPQKSRKELIDPIAWPDGNTEVVRTAGNPGNAGGTFRICAECGGECPSITLCNEPNYPDEGWTRIVFFDTAIPNRPDENNDEAVQFRNGNSEWYQTDRSFDTSDETKQHKLALWLRYTCIDDEAVEHEDWGGPYISYFTPVVVNQCSRKSTRKKQRSRK